MRPQSTVCMAAYGDYGPGYIGTEVAYSQGGYETSYVSRVAPSVEKVLLEAIGELVTCSRCIGTWVAAGLASTQIIAPQFGRLLTWTLATGGANDFLQAGFAALAAKANELEERPG